MIEIDRKFALRDGIAIWERERKRSFSFRIYLSLNLLYVRTCRRIQLSRAEYGDIFAPMRRRLRDQRDKERNELTCVSKSILCARASHVSRAIVKRQNALRAKLAIGDSSVFHFRFSLVGAEKREKNDDSKHVWRERTK